MGRLDIYSSGFWLLLSIYIAVESYRLDLGNWHTPGPGYFSFGAALLLGVMSLSVFVKALLKPSKGETLAVAPEEVRWQNVVLVLASMFFYVLLLNSVGFVLCTFLLLVFFLLGVSRQRFLTAILIASLVTIGSYIVFDILLNAQLPKGILGV